MRSVKEGLSSREERESVEGGAIIPHLSSPTKSFKKRAVPKSQLPGLSTLEDRWVGLKKKLLRGKDWSLLLSSPQKISSKGNGGRAFLGKEKKGGKQHASKKRRPGEATLHVVT